jgi:predicted ATP-dependent endonuclease of OLD family
MKKEEEYNEAMPFAYGKIAENKDFAGRENDIEHLTANFKGHVNTTIISPRRWGKTSLVQHVLTMLSKDKKYYTAKVDIFNCRTEEQFFTSYVNAIMKATATKFDAFTQAVKQYLGSFSPKFSISDDGQKVDFSVSLDFHDKNYSIDDILDLPQRIATDKKKNFIVCIDEFQTVNEYDDPIGFQRKLRAHWQLHNSVSYCLFGSKRHMLMDIFGNYEMPFYRFGDIMFLEKIPEDVMSKFVVKRFKDTGKTISPKLAAELVRMVDLHPYYIQQLAQQSWLRTADVCSEEIVKSACNSIVAQLSLLFSNLMDSLTPKQINFLYAIVDGVDNFSSTEVLKKYSLGTSANIKNLRNALVSRDIVDLMPGKKMEIQDPMFVLWLKGLKRPI